MPEEKEVRGREGEIIERRRREREGDGRGRVRGGKVVKTGGRRGDDDEEEGRVRETERRRGK